MAYQVRLMSEPGKEKIFPISGANFRLGGAPDAAVSLPGQGLPNIIVQFKITDQGCQGVCRAWDIVVHDGVALSAEKSAFLWKVGEELRVGENRLLLESAATNKSPVRRPPVLPPSARIPAPPPPGELAPVEAVSSGNAKPLPEESDPTRIILLGILGAVVILFVILIFTFGTDGRNDKPESYTIKQVYGLADAEGMSDEFKRMLLEANLNEARNPRHALDHYTRLQQDLLRKLKHTENQEYLEYLRRGGRPDDWEPLHPAAYGEKGKILGFLNQGIGRMKRAISNPDR